MGSHLGIESLPTILLEDDDFCTTRIEVDLQRINYISDHLSLFTKYMLWVCKIFWSIVLLDGLEFHE